MSGSKETTLTMANKAFRVGDYEKAIKLYQEFKKQLPERRTHVNLNLALAKKSSGLISDLAEELSLLSKEKNRSDEVLCDIDDLQPAFGLESLGESRWQCTSEDPHFFVNVAAPSSGPSYALLTLKLASTSKVRTHTAKLYFDFGEGFSEDQTKVLIVRNDKKSERVIYFDKPLKAVRFDPCEAEIDIEIKKFSLCALEDARANELIVSHLKKKKAYSKEQSESERYATYNDLTSNGSDSASYEDWIELVEKPSLPSYAEAQAEIAKFKYRPLISVVMPTYNTDEVFLRECIESVLGQSYSNLEFCIADDCSPEPHVARVVREYAQTDSRVKFVQRTENGHISRATNSAIDVATGDFIALLDHDDMLPEHAFYYVVEAINKNPGAKIIYSDEDKIDLSGKRTSPHFKSDWNPDLFYSQNYVSHLGVYDAKIIKKIGGFRAGVEGSQDQDLLLRCLPHVKHEEILHIPKILYHWRMLEGSTALQSGAKSYTTQAGIKALSDYFKENGPEGVTVEAGLLPNTYKVNWPIPKPEPKVTLLIPTRDRKSITELAVRSILEKTSYPNYEIVILDNGSVEPETLAFFRDIQKEDKRVSVLRYDYPFNYSAINNFGVNNTQGDIVGLINNDVEVIGGNWLTEMVSHTIRSDVGCVGAKLYYSNGLIQHAGVILGIGGVAGHSHKYFPRNASGYFSRLKLVQNLSAVTAAVFTVRREVYERVGGLNENDLKVAFNDVDFCLKVKQAGYRNLWTPFAELYHHESISRGHEDTPEKQARFSKEVGYMQRNWKKQLARDKYYNPNLTKKHEDFSISV